MIHSWHNSFIRLFAYRDGTLLGTLVLDPAHYDFPWFTGIFTPTADFESVRPLFDKDLEPLNSSTDDDPFPDAWDTAWEAISQPGLRILSADDTEFTSDPLSTLREPRHGGAEPISKVRNAKHALQQTRSAVTPMLPPASPPPPFRMGRA